VWPEKSLSLHTPFSCLFTHNEGSSLPSCHLGNHLKLSPHPVPKSSPAPSRHWRTPSCFPTGLSTKPATQLGLLSWKQRGAICRKHTPLYVTAATNPGRPTPIRNPGRGGRDRHLERHPDPKGPWPAWDRRRGRGLKTILVS
jgi:hypothetical protein